MSARILAGDASQRLTRVMHILADAESNFNDKSINSIGAQGAYQFTPETQAHASKQGLTPAQGDLFHQTDQTIKFIALNHPQAYQAITQEGDFDKAANLLRNRWTSLPGAAESNWDKSGKGTKLENYISGSFQPKFIVQGA